jgi:hypothetical protein
MRRFRIDGKYMVGPQYRPFAFLRTRIAYFDAETIPLFVIDDWAFVQRDRLTFSALLFLEAVCQSFSPIRISKSESMGVHTQKIITEIITMHKHPSKLASFQHSQAPLCTPSNKGQPNN